MKITAILFSFAALTTYSMTAYASDPSDDKVNTRERRLTIGEARMNHSENPPAGFGSTQPSHFNDKGKRLTIGNARQDPYAQLRDPSQPHGLDLNKVHSMQQQKRRIGIGDDITTTIMLYQQGKHRLEELAKQAGSEKKLQALKTVTDKQAQRIQAALGLTPAQIAAIPAWVPQ
jgi:hypothetical protein